eukprot:scaffold1.g5557.t1
MYQGVLAVVLGQDLPPAGSAFLAQAFAASISVLGVTSFAMLCQARRAGAAPGVAVVLTEHREKLEMEGIFRESIPQEERAGMQIVFRQGSPLNPAALRMVAATSAKAVILSGDYSRPPIEADAQCLRTACSLLLLVDALASATATVGKPQASILKSSAGALQVLLDEMCVEEHGPDGWAAGRGPAVVAQVKTDDGLDMVHGSCSDRIIPVPTTQACSRPLDRSRCCIACSGSVNVRRLSRLLRHPIASMFARMLTDYSSAAHGCLVDAPQLVGRRFDELHAFFCRSLVVGIASSGSSVGELNPPPSRVVQPGDRLDVSPLAVTTPHDYFGSQAGWQDGPRCGCGEAARGEAGRGRALESVDPFRRSGFAMRPAYLPPVPVQFQAAPVAEAEHLLICGWGLENKMWALLQELDHGINPMPAGSRITLVNDHIMTRQYLGGWDGAGGWLLKGEGALQACCVVVVVAAIVLCDTKWGAGVAREFSTDLGLSQSEMLRLDAGVLLVQLNLRRLQEKMTYIGMTRFEDTGCLPLGVAVNAASYSAKLLTHTALQPMFLAAYQRLGTDAELFVQACATDRPLDAVVNPQGEELRRRWQVFNRGDGRCKLVTLARPEVISSRGSSRSSAASVAGSTGSRE